MIGDFFQQQKYHELINEFIAYTINNKITEILKYFFYEKEKKMLDVTILMSTCNLAFRDRSSLWKHQKWEFSEYYWSPLSIWSYFKEPRGKRS